MPFAGNFFILVPPGRIGCCGVDECIPSGPPYQARRRPVRGWPTASLSCLWTKPLARSGPARGRKTMPDHDAVTIDQFTKQAEPFATLHQTRSDAELRAL